MDFTLGGPDSWINRITPPTISSGSPRDYPIRPKQFKCISSLNWLVASFPHVFFLDSSQFSKSYLVYVSVSDISTSSIDQKCNALS